MNKTLVAIFDNEEAAFGGLTALKDLHSNGDITLYDSAILTKDRFGQARIVKNPENPPTGTFLGMFMGALVGVLGGPIGLAVGTATGTLVVRLSPNDGATEITLDVDFVCADTGDTNTITFKLELPATHAPGAPVTTTVVAPP